ncbi:uncharacterized protein LOC128961067 [Oppia nitens]|uniref:uncharacterized protein LOC128961067 n=1 Tax=Oppia nitens TaxID=1686743 RepID=UPI0023D9DC1E|nr:uncharacterized protein LOC128961067 [Oppia nitens]
MSYIGDRRENFNEYDDRNTRNPSTTRGSNQTNETPSLYHKHQENVANQRFHRSNEGIPAISVEDFRLLRECNRESFWKRCLPLSAACVVGMFYVAGRQNMKPKVWHIISGTFFGWFLGKFSYRGVCEDRLINSNSDSPFVTAMRRRRGIIRDDITMDKHITGGDDMMTTDQTRTDSSYWDQPTNDIQGYGAHEFADYNKDEDRKGDDVSKSYTTYDDLRAQNRAAAMKSNNLRPYSA